MITEHFIPSLRVLEAKKLREKGMSQTRIASLLGVTQPAVKQYLEEDELAYRKKLISMGMREDEVDELLYSLSEVLEKENVENTMSFITTRSLILLSELRFCNFHRSVDKEVPINCAICTDIYKEDEETLMYNALALLQNPLVSQLIPQVLSNIAFARRGAMGYNDVLAIPGRIANVRGIPTTASKPQWGSSKHLSKILLSITEKCPEIRSVMDIKYDKSIENSIALAKLRYSKVGPQDSADDDQIAQALKSVFDCSTDVVIHLGGRGLEPIAYVFGRNPLDVAEKVIKISRLYSSN